MFVIAEVPETFVALVKPGYHAAITTDGLTEKLRGTVQQVSLEVAKNEVLSTDPAALSDARVINVKILLENGRLAEHLIHAQARVLIEP
jgi:HlyD family secretion protein